MFRHWFYKEEPCFGMGLRRGFRHGLRRGYGLGRGFKCYYGDEKARLEFVKKELELRLEYISKELEKHPDDPELNFVKREIENRIGYINDLIAKAAV